MYLGAQDSELHDTSRDECFLENKTHVDSTNHVQSLSGEFSFSP